MRRIVPIILIHSYQGDLDRGVTKAIRETWLKNAGKLIPACFIYSSTRRPTLEDEIIFDVPDGYLKMPWRTRAAAYWALSHGFNYVFLVPGDTYVAVWRLLLSEFTKHEYTGFKSYTEHYIGGGSGIWLGRPALEAVAAFAPYEDYDDRWIGAACAAGKVDLHHDPRYWDIKQPYRDDIITAHLHQGAGLFDPADMYKMHERFMAGRDLNES